MLRKLRNQQGFTLIELIAVIAILAILAIIIVPRVGNYSTKAQLSKAKADLTIVKNAIERYDAEHDAALADDSKLSDVKTSLTSTSTGSSGTSCGPYIDKIPAEWADQKVSVIRATDPEKVTGATSNSVTITP